MILSGQVFVPRPVAFQYGFHEPNFGVYNVHPVFQGVHFDTEQLLRHLIFAEKFINYIISHAPPQFPDEKCEFSKFSRAAYAAI